MELALQNLISPIVLCFVLGAVARWVKSDFEFPDAVYQSMSIYLLLAIGLKGGVAHGGTDEFGYRAVDHVATVYDLWATVLHQLGIDHEKLTFRWSGRDLRLTDVHGEVWKDLIA